MNQLSFFKQQPIIKKLDKTLLKPKKLENVNPIFPPNKYIIYPTNGWHYFKNCQLIPEHNKYKQKIWPFISYKTDKGETKISSVRWGTTTGYPTVSLDRVDGRIAVPYLMHVIVGEAFVPKIESNKKLEVAHMYDEDCCYLPEFLLWQTRGENQNGKKSRKPSIDIEWKSMLAQGSVKE